MLYRRPIRGQHLAPGCICGEEVEKVIDPQLELNVRSHRPPWLDGGPPYSLELPPFDRTP
jgi:hypothetical protein